MLFLITLLAQKLKKEKICSLHMPYYQIRISTWVSGIRKDENIIILPGNKGNIIVVKERSDYQKKILDMLTEFP